MIGDLVNQQSSKVVGTQHLALIPVYAVFVSIAMYTRQYIAGDEFSCTLTLSAIFQCLAFCLLVVNMFLTSSTKGLSSRMLQLQAIACCLRLSSTTWLLGYLPLDKSGDYEYQGFDIVSLAMACLLLYKVRKAQAEANDSDGDTLPATPLAVICWIGAVLMHADLDERPIFDAMWMCGIFIQAIAMLPQLWMTMRSASKVPGVMNHFSAVMVISCIFSASYMWDGRDELTFDRRGIHYLAAYSLLTSHGVWSTLLCSFGCVSVWKYARPVRHVESAMELQAKPLLVV